MQLYDGKDEIKRIHILGMYRSNEKYLNNFLINTLKEMEKMYNVEFKYYFMERSSRLF